MCIRDRKKEEKKTDYSRKRSSSSSFYSSSDEDSADSRDNKRRRRQRRKKKKDSRSSERYAKRLSFSDEFAFSSPFSAKEIDKVDKMGKMNIAGHTPMPNVPKWRVSYIVKGEGWPRTKYSPFFKLETYREYKELSLIHI